MINRPLLLLTAAAISLVALSAARAGRMDVIPKPQTVQPADGHFVIDATTTVRLEGPSADTADALRCLTTRLKSVGVDLKEAAAGDSTDKAIVLSTTGSDQALGEEGYTLQVTPGGIVIRANASAGLFYGVQTLLQMLPPQVFAAAPTAGTVLDCACVSVTDRPRFKWRGLMLDVSRHFFTKAEVLRLLDEMAAHKLNVFHWHLTDDQGWRIEIKKYPKLTEIGAWRDSAGFDMDPKLSTTFGPDGKYGGFYTQDDVREVVAFAAARHITIVPEIEMPGHATAALRAYPDIGTPAAPSKETKGDAGIFNGVYDPTKEQTFTFLEDVLTEVIGLFPGQFIHIGGDEVPKEPWKNDPAAVAFMKQHHLADAEHLQSYFVKRIDAFITSKGRRMLGWDEILEGGLAPGAAVMSWRGIQGGIAASKAGHDVVMTPTTFCYLDGEQALNTEPHERGAVLGLKKVYSYEPIPAEIPPDQRHRVLGVQGNLWTEYVPNFSWVQYMFWPRGAALAEVGWTAAADRQWDDFSRRLAVEEQRLDAAGVNYRPARTDTLTDAIRLDGGKIVIANPIVGATIRYTLDGTYPTADSPAYTGPVTLPGGWVQATARYFQPGKIATPAAAAAFLDGRTVTVTATSAKEWETRTSVFYTRRWGGGPNETVTVAFKDGATDLPGVTVRSGLAGKPDTQVKQGFLEISTDGLAFAPGAEFKDGVAHVDLAGKPIVAFRVRFVDAQLPHPVLTTVTLN